MSNQKAALKQFIAQTIPVNTNEIEEIVSSFQAITLAKNEHLLCAGELNDDYLFLESGLIRAYLLDLEGNEITIDFYTSNNIVFEVTSFFQRVKSEVNLQALTDCKAFVTNYEKLNTLFHAQPAFRDFGRAILVKEFISSKQRNISMINQSAETRYENLITAKPEIFIHSPLKYIASYLGITDSTLSRIRSRHV